MSNVIVPRQLSARALHTHSCTARPSRGLATPYLSRLQSSLLPHIRRRLAITTRQQQPPPRRHFVAMASATTIYDFKPLDKRGVEVPMSEYKGKVVLVVNTASKCGFTPQYAGLEKLWKAMQEKHPDEFVILGFPCNQFGNQEPGSNDDIQQFCQLNYGVTFPIMGKVDVNGKTAEPLFEALKAEKPRLFGMKRVLWNFEKFLIGKGGKVVGRWGSWASPASLEGPILKELAK